MPRGVPGRLLAFAAVVVVGAAVLRLAVTPPERCPAVTAAELRAGAAAAIGWFERNQHPDGRWLYAYDATTDTDLGDYNVVRHSGVLMALYQAAADGFPEALPGADRGLAWSLERLVRRDGWQAVQAFGDASTGSSALLVAGLAYRRLATGDPTHDDTVRALARFLEAQTEPSGAVLAYFDDRTGAPVPGVYSKYYTGETYQALGLLHLVLPGEGWGATAERIGTYLATERDRTEGYFPPLPDHWAGYGLGFTAAFPERPAGTPLTAAEAAYAERQAGLFGAQVRWVAQEGAGRPGSAFRPGGPLRGGGHGVIGEALGGLWQAARADRRLAGIVPAIAERATCNAALTLEAQVDAAEAAATLAPERTEGAWFRGGETRMDDQQHALSALLLAARIVEAGDPAGPADPRVSAWLLALLLVAALNPARQAAGVPRAGRSRGQVAAVAAAGALAASGVLVVLAAVGDALLDALDVSGPAARIAAGIVVGVAALADLVRRPPSPEPALPGWGAALVPVAVPLVARPALLALAVSAGADRGAGLVAVALLAGVAGLVGVAALGPDAQPAAGPGLRVRGWAGRATGAVAAALAVALVVDGVLAV